MIIYICIKPIFNLIFLLNSYLFTKLTELTEKFIKKTFFKLKNFLEIYQKIK